VTSFHTKKVPAISISEYLERFALYLPCEEAVYIVALIYIDRLVAYHPTIFITGTNVHR
jgi:hypothetical protein